MWWLNITGLLLVSVQQSNHIHSTIVSEVHVRFGIQDFQRDSACPHSLACKFSVLARLHVESKVAHQACQRSAPIAAQVRACAGDAGEDTGPLPAMNAMVL